jgi:CTP-dependent riboflavin kinase
MIEGVVCRGTGQATAAFTERRLRELVDLFGWRPVPGTFNVRVRDLESSVLLLGEPAALTEHESRIGPLRWWHVLLTVQPIERLPALVVRGQKSRAPYLEVVSDLRIRSLGVSDGETVLLTPNGP